MGQKVHPTGFRLGINKSWNSNWFAGREYGDLLHEDLSIRKYVKGRMAAAGISKVEIERTSKLARVNIYTARPGIVIGKKGSEVDKLKAELEKMTGKQVFINIKEVRNAEIDAQLVAENIALQLERRVSFRRAMKRSVTTALRFGAKGIRIACAGRLGGGRDGPPGMVSRGARSAAYSSGGYRLWCRRGQDHLWNYWCKSLDFQGRDIGGTGGKS